MKPASRHEPQLARWVHEHGPSVLGFLLARVRDRHLAEDLVQETFFRAWRGRERYTDRGQERAYLVRIADRLVLDARRRGGMGRDDLLQTVGQPSEAGGETPLDKLLRAESAAVLAEALDCLSEPQRRTLLLRYYGQLPFDQIASLLGCPLGTALSHCRRGLAALRKLLVEEKR
jgi:RNA polymerase sigma-70 factor (ECF subfamily)